VKYLTKTNSSKQKVRFTASQTTSVLLYILRKNAAQI